MKRFMSLALLLSISHLLDAKKLVPVTCHNPQICVDTTRSPKKCKVVEEVAQRLSMVQEDLRAVGLGLKVLEGYSRAPQEAYLETSDFGVIAMPEECKRHTSGASVDVTLVDSSGNEIEMPCEYDDFCVKANPCCADVSEVAIAHRSILRDVMMKHGFIPSELNWWHFDLENWKEYKKTNKNISCPEACQESCPCADQASCSSDCPMNIIRSTESCSQNMTCEQTAECCNDEALRCPCSGKKTKPKKNQSRCGCSAKQKVTTPKQPQPNN